jgi:hypothetical protein
MGALGGFGSGVLGSLLGGGGIGDSLKTGALGGLGGMLGQAAGLDPALAALLGGTGANLLGESAAQRKAQEADMNARREMLSGVMNQAQQAYGAYAPMRAQAMSQAMGALQPGALQGMFGPTDPSNPGNMFPQPQAAAPPAALLPMDQPPQTDPMKILGQAMQQQPQPQPKSSGPRTAIQRHLAQQ